MKVKVTETFCGAPGPQAPHVWRLHPPNTPAPSCQAPKTLRSITLEDPGAVGRPLYSRERALSVPFCAGDQRGSWKVVTLKAAAITAELSHGLVLSLNNLFCALVPGALVPGALVPGALVPGALVPGALVPGALVPGALVAHALVARPYQPSQPSISHPFQPLALCCATYCFGGLARRRGGVRGVKPPRKFQLLSLSFTGWKHQFLAATGTVPLPTHHT